MIAAPPFDVGAVKVIVACPFPGAAVNEVGGVGLVAAIAGEHALVMFALETELVAITLTLNDFPTSPAPRVSVGPVALTIKTSGDPH